MYVENYAQAIFVFRRMIPRISLVVPCRNEAVRLPETLGALSTFLDGAKLSSEVLIVVERSEDESASLVADWAKNDPRFRAICNQVARGKGFAVRTGMLSAAGEIVFFMDADLSVPLRFVTEFLGFFEDGVDVVFGSRQHPHSKITRAQPDSRVFFGRTFNFWLRVLGATKFRDTQCGFKAFRHDTARAVFSRLTLDGFGFDVEALALAEALGFRILERPVEWRDAPGSKVRALRDGTAAFWSALFAAHRARRVVAGEARSRK